MARRLFAKRAKMVVVMKWGMLRKDEANEIKPEDRLWTRGVGEIVTPSPRFRFPLHSPSQAPPSTQARLYQPAQCLLHPQAHILYYSTKPSTTDPSISHSLSPAMDASQYNGQFHRASEAAPGVLLLEFNRCVALWPPTPRALGASSPASLTDHTTVIIVAP